MRVFIASLILLAALVGQAVTSESPPRAGHRKAAHPLTPAVKTSDVLPMPDVRPPDRDVVREPLGRDKSLHYGNVTVTPGGFLDVGTGGGGRE